MATPEVAEQGEVSRADPVAMCCVHLQCVVGTQLLEANFFLPSSPNLRRHISSGFPDPKGSFILVCKEEETLRSQALQWTDSTLPSCDHQGHGPRPHLGPRFCPTPPVFLPRHQLLTFLTSFLFVTSIMCGLCLVVIYL